MDETQTLTGYPSIDKPWLKHYPDFLLSQERKLSSIYDKIWNVWTNDEETIINYYDTTISTKDFFEKVHMVAKSLISLGIKENDSIAVSLESVPEFLELFLACEMIGCSIKNFIEPIKDSIELINSCTSSLYITQDYISKFDVEYIYNNSHIEHIVLVPPLYSTTSKIVIRDNIQKNINKRYTTDISNDCRNISWKNFLESGISINDIKKCSLDNILFSAFTSGTSGKPKEVLHTSKTLMGIINQLALFPSHEKGKDTWLLTILPPSLVAIVVAMMFYPLADGKQLILDPFCDLEDLDIEMMNYRPNCWGLIPIFFNTILESKRIPEDFDMSFFKLFGFGAEPMTNKFIARVQDFLDKHNCKAPFSSVYGQSEGGSDFTVCIGREMIASGSAGMPLIDTTISIFDPISLKELKYGEVGEVCKFGPGLMVGYSDAQKTNEVLKKHDDGNVWLHTGDYGFMIKEGLLFVLGRQGINVYPDKTIYPLPIENKILTVGGIKEAIIVAGKDNDNEHFEKPYLFIILENKNNEKQVLNQLQAFINNNLLPEEQPKEIFVIDKKPISHFKTDRRFLQMTYELL